VRFDPFRVGIEFDSFPGALPPAIEFHAFSVRNWPPRFSEGRFQCGIGDVFGVSP
jgi:hypothetical protein